MSSISSQFQLFDESPSKKCSSCHQTKSVAEFGKDSRKGDGLRIYCKPCASAYAEAIKGKTGAAKDRAVTYFELNPKTLIDAKICPQCKKALPFGAFYADRSRKDGRKVTCKQCSNVAAYGWRLSNPDRHRENKRRNRMKHRDAINATMREQNRSGERKAKEAERRKRLKEECYQAYGGYRCACCGETEPLFLCIDHVNNDGYEHRKTVDPSRLYYWLKKEGYPKDYQVLCYNCNAGKARNSGVCPHVKK